MDGTATSPQDVLPSGAPHHHRTAQPQDNTFQDEHPHSDVTRASPADQDQNSSAFAPGGTAIASSEPAQQDAPASLYVGGHTPDGVYSQTRGASLDTGTEALQEMATMELNGTALGFPTSATTLLMESIPGPASLPMPAHVPQALEPGSVMVAGAETQIPAPIMFPCPPEGMGFSVNPVGLGPQPIGVPDLVHRIHDLEEHNKELQNEKARLERQLEAFASFYEVVFSASSGLQHALSQQGLSLPDVQHLSTPGRKRKPSGSLSVPRLKKAKGKDSGTVPQV